MRWNNSTTCDSTEYIHIGHGGIIFTIPTYFDTRMEHLLMPLGLEWLPDMDRPLSLRRLYLVAFSFDTEGIPQRRPYAWKIDIVCTQFAQIFLLSPCLDNLPFGVTMRLFAKHPTPVARQLQVKRWRSARDCLPAIAASKLCHVLLYPNHMDAHMFRTVLGH